MIKKRMIKGTPSFKPDFLTFRSIQQNSITCSYTGFQPVSRQNFRNIACSVISDYPSRIRKILTPSFCMPSYANANVKVQNRTWHRDAGPLHCWWPKVGEDFWMLVTKLRCWWHLLVPDQYGPYIYIIIIYGPCKMTLYRWPCFWIRTYDTNNVGPTIQWWTWNKRKLWYHVTLQLAWIMTSKIWYYCVYLKMNSDRAFTGV